jgi:hypothetical protein
MRCGQKSADVSHAYTGVCCGAESLAFPIQACGVWSRMTVDVGGPVGREEDGDLGVAGHAGEVRGADAEERRVDGDDGDLVVVVGELLRCCCGSVGEVAPNGG